MRTLLVALLATSSVFAHEVITITQPILDYFFFVNDDFLTTIHGEKGGRELIADEVFMGIVSKIGTAHAKVPGGTSANVMKALAQLDHKVAVIGKVGRDEAGEYYAQELRNMGVTSLMLCSESFPTGKSAILVTPDGERTMRTVLGAAIDTKEFPLNKEDFEGIRLLHFEGYNLYDKPRIYEAVSYAKSQNALVSMDVSCFEVARTHKEFLFTYLKGNVDILFANQYEAEILTGCGPEEACTMLSQHCSVAVVTMGKYGCWVQKGDEKCFVPALSVNTIDSTGAGDCFAAGFLHGYLTGLPLADCAWIGTLVASEVVQVIGGQIPKDRWNLIHHNLEQKGFTLLCQDYFPAPSPTP